MKKVGAGSRKFSTLTDHNAVTLLQHNFQENILSLCLCSNFQLELFAVILIVNRFSYQILIAGKSIGFHPLPPYLRFDTVRVDYREYYYKGLGTESEAEKCDWMRLMVLETIKKALIGAKCEFLWHESYYIDDNILLNHIEKDLIPICNFGCSYMFHIDATWLYHNSAKLSNIICTILQKLTPITCCSKVEFTLKNNEDEIIQVQLPVEIISNWFNRVIDGQKQKLKIEMTIGISNLSEMVEHIKI